MRVEYLGSESRVYPGYTDSDTGETLAVYLGGRYNVQEMPDDNRFRVIEDEEPVSEETKESVTGQDALTPEEEGDQ